MSTRLADGFEALAGAARSELTDPGRSITIGDGEARFELYHFGFSICSQKVRTALAEKGVPFIAHELNMSENYRPGYVRLRLFAAGPERRARLARGHTMRTAVATEGFDACVVPLLVDPTMSRAVVDSAEILDYIEAQIPEPPLVPLDLAAAVREQVRINDGIPHPGMLYGFLPDDPRPKFWIEAMEGVYDRKCEVLGRYLAENRDDPELAGAYQAKIDKELAGKALQKDHAYLGGIIDEFRAILARLDEDLARHEGEWICGSAFTMADVTWAVSLYRIQWLGHAYLWNDHPRVGEYAARLYERPSVRTAIIGWSKLMPPSPHTVEVDRRSQ